MFIICIQTNLDPVHMRNITASPCIQGQKVNRKAFLFCQAFTKNILFKFDLILLAHTIPKLFVCFFLNQSIRIDFTNILCVFGSRCQRSFCRKMSRFKVVGIWSLFGIKWKLLKKQVSQQFLFSFLVERVR